MLKQALAYNEVLVRGRGGWTWERVSGHRSFTLVLNAMTSVATTHYGPTFEKERTDCLITEYLKS